MTPRAHCRPLAALAVLTLSLAACSSGGSGDDKEARSDDPAPSTTGEDGGEAKESAVYPGTDWAQATPEEAGLDAAVLDALAVEIQSHKSNCLAVTRGGKLVAEWYWNGTDASTTHEIWSASKSYTSALVGIAQGEGALDIDEPASKYLTEWQGTPSEDVTIRNLLSNDSGREWSYQIDYGQMALDAPDKSAFAIGLSQQIPPGSDWVYNNSAIQTLEEVLQRATGRDVAEYAQEKLFDPIGMDGEMTKDKAGNTLAFMGVQASCRDFARFGYLFGREGDWAGEQVVPADYVEEAITPSTELNNGYGFLWWLNRPGIWEDPVGGVMQADHWIGVPEDAFAAQGLGGQVSLVIPSLDVVVTRIGPADIGDTTDYTQIMGAAMVAAVGDGDASNAVG